VSYFTSTTPDSEHKRARLKLILFLAGSSLYDALVVKQKFAGRETLLRIECAILDARMGDDRAVLVGLVHDVRDVVSAEVYCMLGGGAEGVLSRKVALGVAESAGLGPWFVGLSAGTPSVDSEVKGCLLRTLLEVHMSDP
jgi:hypothetical protein